MASDASVTSTSVLVEQRGTVAVITLDEPGTRNALTLELLAGLRRAATEVAGTPDVRAAVLTGTGTAFAAGADLRVVGAATPEENLAYNRAILDAFAAVAALEVPTVAALNGHALGGGLELALACTFRVAADDARLGLPEVRLGLLPGAGGTQRLPRLIGRSAALRLLLTGEPVDSGRALALGLVDEVAPAGDVLDRALVLANRIAANAPLAVRAVLRAVRDGTDRPLAEGIEAAHEELRPLLASDDLREGVAAFLGKRLATFTGA